MSENQTLGLIRDSLISSWEEAAYKKAFAFILKLTTQDPTAWSGQPVDPQTPGALPDGRGSPHAPFLAGACGAALLHLRNGHAHSPPSNT